MTNLLIRRILIALLVPFCITTTAVHATPSIGDSSILSNEDLTEITRFVQGKTYSYNLDEALEFIDSVEATNADLSFAPYYVVTGITYYLTENYFESIFRFRKALEPGQNFGELNEQYIEANKSMAWLNLGSSYKKLGMVDSALACFLRTPLTKSNRELVTNNIAAIYIDQRKYAEAAAFLEDIDLNEVSNQDFSHLIRINLMTCYVKLGLLEKAKLYYNESFEVYFPYADTTGIKNVLDFYVLSNDTARFLALANKYKEYFIRKNNESEPYSLIINILDIYESDVTAFKEGWMVYKSHRLPKVEGSVIPTNYFSLKIFWFNLNLKTKREILLKLFLFAALCFFAGFLLRRYLTNNTKQSNTKALEELPQQSQKTKNDLLSQLEEDELAFLKKLSLKEANVLKLILQGMNTKEIADQMSCSLGYIYNIRSSIRKKFEQTFEDQGFEEWLKFKL